MCESSQHIDEADEKLIGILIVISTVSKNLTRKLGWPSQTGQSEEEDQV